MTESGASRVRRVIRYENLGKHREKQWPSRGFFHGLPWPSGRLQSTPWSNPGAISYANECVVLLTNAEKEARVSALPGAKESRSRSCCPPCSRGNEKDLQITQKASLILRDKMRPFPPLQENRDSADGRHLVIMSLVTCSIRRRTMDRGRVRVRRLWVLYGVFRMPYCIHDTTSWTEPYVEIGELQQPSQRASYRPRPAV